MKTRLDRLLVERGLAPDVEKARQLILAGEVRVDGHPSGKAGSPVPGDAVLTIHPRRGSRSGSAGRASRGGAKLDGAMDAFGVSPAGRTALDIGASTGGFTEALLRRGAARVVALDVGRGLLDWALRTDPRVTVVEGVNARFLVPGDLPPLPAPVDLVTCDVSFISLRLVLPAIARLFAAPEAGSDGAGGEALLLVKPQFEAPRERVGEGGIVRDPADWRAALASVAAAAGAEGFEILGVCASPLPGAGGNREFFLHAAAPGGGAGAAGRALRGEELDRAIEAAVASAPV